MKWIYSWSIDRRFRQQPPTPITLNEQPPACFPITIEQQNLQDERKRREDEQELLKLVAKRTEEPKQNKEVLCHPSFVPILSKKHWQLGLYGQIGSLKSEI